MPPCYRPYLPCCRLTQRSTTYGYSLQPLLYYIRLQADSALNHMLKNKFASSQFLLTLVLEQLDEAEAARGSHVNGAIAPATSGANGAARSTTNGVVRSTIVVNGTNNGNGNGNSSSNNHLASSFEPKEKPKRGPASLVRQVRGLPRCSALIRLQPALHVMYGYSLCYLRLQPPCGVRQVHDLLLQCADWTHKREVFLQLEAGTYQSARPPVDLETLLRRIGGDELDVDCCRSCDAAKRVAIDSQMLAVQIEEALANARKYRQKSSRLKLSARIQRVDDIDEIGEDGEIGEEIGEIGLETSLTNQPAAKATGAAPKNGSSLAHSAPLLGSASLAKVPAATPAYYRCSS